MRPRFWRFNAAIDRRESPCESQHYPFIGYPPIGCFSGLWLYTVSAPAFAYDPSGHKLRATITLCSRDEQNGMCITESIKFTP